ncbi:MAG: hypothetical protein HY711_04020, partial [Candidatus Melainabacteria bacterium]|nr:hypothetical protein [Candidatus Melainabacteria bacterium]
MSLRNKVLICLVLLILAFTGGIWVGCQIRERDVDPQDYVQTVFTPYDHGLDSYLAFLDKAHKSVYVAVYAYTDQRITDKFIELRKS